VITCHNGPYLTEIREEYAWLDPAASIAIQTGGQEVEWWTYAGSQVNATLARQLSQMTRHDVQFDSFTLTFHQTLKLQDVEVAIKAVCQRDPGEMYPSIEEQAIDGLKFSECLPRELAIEMLEHRLQDSESTRKLFQQPVRFVTQQ